MTQRFVICGLNNIGFRVAHSLLDLGHSVMVIGNESLELADALVARGATVHVRLPSLIRGSAPEHDVAGAEAFLALLDDDLRNLQLALSVREANPDVRLVVRMFNQELGARLEKLLAPAAVCSMSALAAPEFVHAALYDSEESIFGWRGERFTIVQLDEGASAAFAPGQHTSLPGLADWAIVRSKPLAGLRPARGRGLAMFDSLPRIGGRWGITLAILLVLVLVSLYEFQAALGLRPIDALYFTITIITTTGFGDISLLSAADETKLYGVVLMLAGAAATAMFYALVTEKLFSTRLAEVLPTRQPRRNHTILCGVGTVGFRILEGLLAAREPVVVIDHRPDSRFVRLARAKRVHVIIGDARLPETLELAGIRRARCIVAATNDDLGNIEIALLAHERQNGARDSTDGRAGHDLRIVLRVFDADLASAARRHFGVHVAHSASALAARAFTAAALARPLIEQFEVAGRRFEMVEVDRGAEIDAGAAVVAARHGIQLIVRAMGS